MENNKKQGRYTRIYAQLVELMKKSENPNARMCSIAAILHHKMDGFFWTGFYSLTADKNLIVSNYQGPIACMELTKNTGVCWAGINEKKTIIVGNVNDFPGHITCDSRSKSEIVIPITNKIGDIVAVLDIDSDMLHNFDETDAKFLEKIVKLIYS